MRLRYRIQVLIMISLIVIIIGLYEIRINAPCNASARLQKGATPEKISDLHLIM